MTDDPIHSIADMIEKDSRDRGVSRDEAAEKFRLIGVPGENVQEALNLLNSGARRVLDEAGNIIYVSDWEYRTDPEPTDKKRPRRVDEWYVGPREWDRFWPAYEHKLRQALPEGAVSDIDTATNAIVALSANPTNHRNQRKGLVLGYVQSGKTANYAAVIAKAADAGYRLVIVLAGMHNGLRQQTQMRLERDLGVAETHNSSWVPLTDADSDFGNVMNGTALAKQMDLRMLAVVKKNIHRLTNLRNWLKNMPEATLVRLPALIIDDEADQATPNTRADRDERSAINERLREILELLPTGTYLGYTATPFANVLMDPSDDTDLYPRDFIVSLPKPAGYFGSESIFGKILESDEDAGDEADGLDIARIIPPEEVPELTPAGAKARDSFEFRVTDSLDRAIRWFILSVAIRHARGQNRHTSMLVHTTQLVDPQFEAADAIRDALNHMNPTDARFREVWEDEHNRVDPTTSHLEDVEWVRVEQGIKTILRDLRVVVDNGVSDDRLDYNRTMVDEHGNEAPAVETVIAVGGNTLSRGLTLEGLVVSFFCRNAATYDALMQMGRWFGFRAGYQDLPRVWVTEPILSNFRFLSIVEEEIRQDIERYAKEGLTPTDLAVRIRAHPAIAITSRAKMAFARRLQIGYGGSRLQTFRFHHRDQQSLLESIDAAKALVSSALARGSTPEPVADGKYVLRDVSKSVVIDFLNAYHFHETHRDLDSRAMSDYLNKRQDRFSETWSVAIAGRGGGDPVVNGITVKLGQIDLGLAEPIPMINRSRLNIDADNTSVDATADVKALMSRADRFLDVPNSPDSLPDRESEISRLREVLTDGKGLLIIYPISPDSVPMRANAKTKHANDTKPRRAPLEATEPVIGVGIIFPKALSASGSVGEAVYVGVDLLAEDIDETEFAVDERAKYDSEGELRVDLDRAVAEGTDGTETASTSGTIR